ncbi:unnamed protein product [Trichogramma brassicae]|uniref:Uncharacterized protein n=1 Tax=Trichogramma brassicae TaxID=86971 RepID=A0A6H5J585_9HYME|nr:unnamed protein product [Trichogramma brassicae]
MAPDWLLRARAARHSAPLQQQQHQQRFILSLYVQTIYAAPTARVTTHTRRMSNPRKRASQFLHSYLCIVMVRDVENGRVYVRFDARTARNCCCCSPTTHTRTAHTLEFAAAAPHARSAAAMHANEHESDGDRLC